jgi:hypothetical protein
VRQTRLRRKKQNKKDNCRSFEHLQCGRRGFAAKSKIKRTTADPSSTCSAADATSPQKAKLKRQLQILRALAVRETRLRRKKQNKKDNCRSIDFTRVARFAQDGTLIYGMK